MSLRDADMNVFEVLMRNYSWVFAIVFDWIVRVGNCSSAGMEFSQDVVFVSLTDFTMLLTWVSSVVDPCAENSENAKLLELLDTVGLVDTLALNSFIRFDL